MSEKRGARLGWLHPPGGEARRVGSEGALDECSKRLNCGGGVIPGGLEVQGLGEGPPGVLTFGTAEQGVFSGLDLLLTPWAEPWVRAMPVWMAQGVASFIQKRRVAAWRGRVKIAESFVAG